MSYTSNMQRCREEIAHVERSLRDGHPDLEGLCRALVDWSLELRLIQRQMAPRARKPAAACGLAGEIEWNEAISEGCKRARHLGA